MHGSFPELGPPSAFPPLAALEAVPPRASTREVLLIDRRRDSMLVSIFEEAGAAVMAAGRCGYKLPQFQALARVVAGRMGGPVDSGAPGASEQQAMQWLELINEIKMRNKSVVVLLGQLYVGLARHRALLFKALADWMSLPCSLFKGAHAGGEPWAAAPCV